MEKTNEKKEKGKKEVIKRNDESRPSVNLPSRAIVVTIE